MSDQVSELTTNRLSVYLRFLNELDAAGVKSVSSKALAQQFHLNAAQIRKDLANFGDFGVRGVGYIVKDLKWHLRQILGLDRGVRVAIMGAGNLGLALADYPGFRQEGFQIAALFDNFLDKVGKRSRSGVLIYDIKELKRIAKRERITIAVVAVPAPTAQTVVNAVVAANIKAILNFSPGALAVPSGVKLKSVDLTVSLESLSFYLARAEGGLETGAGGWGSGVEDDPRGAKHEPRSHGRPRGDTQSCGLSPQSCPSARHCRTSMPGVACGWSTSATSRSRCGRPWRKAVSSWRRAPCARSAPAGWARATPCRRRASPASWPRSGPQSSSRCVIRCRSHMSTSTCGRAATATRSRPRCGRARRRVWRWRR